MFVSFEGCEGVGKSTQLKLLKDYLEATGQHAVYVREPGSTEISEQIRKVILNPQNTAMTDMTEALLYAASRAQLVREVIKPALERGELVVCDRYVDSSIAYQGYARGLGADTIKQINAPAMEGCLPDVTIFLTCAQANPGARSRFRTTEWNWNLPLSTTRSTKVISTKSRLQTVVSYG